MKHYGGTQIGQEIAEGTEIKNLTTPSGTSFPSNDLANIGELFYRSDENKLYCCTGEGSPATWTEVTGGGGGSYATEEYADDQALLLALVLG